jgi:hypothetical protein
MTVIAEEMRAQETDRAEQSGQGEAGAEAEGEGEVRAEAEAEGEGEAGAEAEGEVREAKAELRDPSRSMQTRMRDGEAEDGAAQKRGEAEAEGDVGGVNAEDLRDTDAQREAEGEVSRVKRGRDC